MVDGDEYCYLLRVLVCTKMGYGAWSMCYHVLCPCLCQSDQEATPAGPSFVLGLILENKQASDLHSTTHVPYSSGVRQYQRLIAITESYSPFTVLPVFDCSYIAR